MVFSSYSPFSNSGLGKIQLSSRSELALKKIDADMRTKQELKTDAVLKVSRSTLSYHFLN